jgi:hypothetical protein
MTQSHAISKPTTHLSTAALSTQVPIPVFAFFLCPKSNPRRKHKMSNDEILSRLSQLTTDPSEAVFSISYRTILSAIVQRLVIVT